MKKRGALLWFCIICTMTVYGQNTSVLQRFGVKTDAAHQRAEINLSGAFPAFALAPNGNCWLVSSEGLPYFTPDIWWSDWHCASPICPENNNDWLGHKLFFFSNDTALLCPRYNSDSSYYYLTTDGGNTWIKKNFGIEVYMMDGCMDEENRLWLTNRNTLLYTEDCGQTFHVLQMPLEDTSPPDYLFTLDMHDGVYGLAALDNFSQKQLLYTDDNWSSAHSVPFPPDADPHRQTDKVLIWNDYWVIKQNQAVFYTRADEVAWQHFPIPVVDFFPDRETGRLMAVTDSLQVVVFNSPTDYWLLCEETLPRLPAEGAVQNGCLYVWCRDRYLCKVNSTEVIPKSQFYTSEQKHNIPTEIYEGKEIRWGIEWKNGRKHLYAADKHGSEWYQHLRLPLFSYDFQLLNDSVALYWDGESHFTLNLITGEAKTTTLEAPLQDFLTAPIIKVEVQSNRGPHHLLHKINNEELAAILADINRRPKQMPAIAEFNITDKDKQRYAKIVRKIDDWYNHIEMDFAHETPVERWWSEFDHYEEFFLSVPDRIDTLSEASLSQILIQTNWSTDADWLILQLFNENGDTLKLFNRLTLDQYAWHLPWTVSYKGIHFKSFLPALSQWLGSVMPKKFHKEQQIVNAYSCSVLSGVPKKFYKERLFDNATFLMQVADYLWMEHLKQVCK